MNSIQSRVLPMKSFRDKLVYWFLAVDEQIQDWPGLIAVRRGLVHMIPLVLLGSMALVILSLPLPAYHEFMTKTFGQDWANLFVYIRDGTFNILSLLMVLSISYASAVEYQQRQNRNVSPIITASVALASFVALSNLGADGFSLASFGAAGAFVAIVVATSSSFLFMKLSSIKRLQIRAFSYGAESNFSAALTAIYPAAITVIIFASLNVLLRRVFNVTEVQTIVTSVSSQLFSLIHSPFWRGICFILFVHIFWFFGIHGSNVLEPVAQTFFVPATAANQLAVSAGEVPTAVFTKSFFDSFVLMGGSGTALCLVLAIILVGRTRRQRQLGKLSLLPVLLNINELVIFGMPMVLNPVFLIPFVLTPLLMTLVSYMATSYQLIPHTINLVEWTTPVFLSGYAATGSIAGSILQGVNLCIGTLCYMPFVVLAEKAGETRAKRKLNETYAQLKLGTEQTKTSSLLSRQDDIGVISRALIADLEHALDNDEFMVFYQPQVHHCGEVIGVEALLRWHHASYGFVSPLLTIALAEEAQLVNRLGYWVMNTACADLKKLADMGLPAVNMSVNVSVMQFENESFVEEITEIISRHQVDPHRLEIELTEQIALSNNRGIADRLKSLRELGVRLAMDDFGMGHSSLMYLKEFQFDTVKLDGALVREILSNPTCCNIIQSIVSLGESLNYSVIAEYVETEEQKRLLHELGCDRYQGYLFSPALPMPQLEQLIKEMYSSSSMV